MTIDPDIPFASEREGIENIINAVNRDRIKQIISISGLGAFQKDILAHVNDFIPNLIRVQGQQIMKDSGIPYTIMHCSWFLDSFAIYQRKGTYSILGYNKHPIFFINGYDYARQIANAIGNEKAFNKEYPIQGKQGMDHLEAAKKFLAIYSPQVKAKPLPMGILRLLALFNKNFKVLKHMATFFYNRSSR